MAQLRGEGKAKRRPGRKERRERWSGRKTGRNPKKYLRTNCPTRCDSASSWISLLQGVRGR
jgi:hypothetical protein